MEIVPRGESTPTDRLTYKRSRSLKRLSVYVKLRIRNPVKFQNVAEIVLDIEI